MKGNRASLENLICNAVRFICAAIVGYLLIVSLFSTAYVTEYERVFFVSDSPLKNALFLIVFISVFYFAKKHLTDFISENSHLVNRICTVLIVVILFFIVISTQLHPVFDQNKVMQAASRMCMHDYSDFIKGGYLQRCDNQYGLVLFYYVLFNIFGQNNYILIQIINVVSIAAILYYVRKITEPAFGKNTACITYAGTCLFMPLWGYVTFVYGTCPSYAFALAAVYLLMKQLKCDEQDINNQTGEINPDGNNGSHNKINASNIRSIAAICFFASVACALKINAIIVIIAAVIMCMVFAVKNKSLYPLVISALIILSVFLSGKITDGIMYNITGIEKEGAPRTMHLTMGLMDNSFKPPGWYNGYVEEKFESNDFDPYASNEEALNDLNDIIKGFKENPSRALSFFVRKTVAQWNEPTFESIFIQCNRDSEITLPKLFDAALDNNRGSELILDIFNVIHLVILFGTFVYLVFVKDNKGITGTFFLLVFLGGFLFHTVWESKSQYNIIYFLLLIPYCVSGYNMLVSSLNGCIKERPVSFKKIHANRGIVFLEVFTFICLIVYFIPNGFAARAVKPSWDNDEYRVYRFLQNDMHIISPGRYYISPKTDSGLVISVTDDAVNDSGTKLSLTKRDENSEQRVIVFYNQYNMLSVRLQSSQLVFDVNGGIIENGNYLQQWEYNGDIGQRFSFEKAGGADEFFILCGDFAVAYSDDGDIILEERKNSENEIWKFMP